MVSCHNIALCSWHLYRVGQKQLSDLNSVPCGHLCRWRGETHVTGYSGLKSSVIMQRWSEEHRAFAVETFFKNNETATVTQRVFRRHFDIGRNGKIPTCQIILNWVTQFRTTASIVNKKPPGHPRTVQTPENVRWMAHAFQRSPQPYLQWSSPEWYYLQKVTWKRNAFPCCLPLFS